MNETFYISLGGLPIQISFSGCFSDRGDDYLSFLIPPDSDSPRWTIRIRKASPAEMDFPKTFSDSSTWSITRGQGRIEINLRWKPGDTFLWKKGELEPAEGRGEILVAERKSRGYTPPLSVIDLLFFPFLFLFEGGFIVHAAAVRFNNRVFLFPAPAGGGKSTWAELLFRHFPGTVLGEDKVIVRKSRGKIRVYGSPWNPRPKFRQPGFADLGGIYFLRQAFGNNLTRLSRGTALKKFLTQIAVPFNRKDDLERAVTAAESILEAGPVFDFSFLPDPTAVRYFREQIES